MIREAIIADAVRIKELIGVYADKEEMLHRPLNDIYEGIRNFFVYEKDGKVIGTAALNVVWEDIAEVRSLAVDKACGKFGVGKGLVDKCLETARQLGVKEVFVLTYVPEYFIKLGFKEIEKHTLPHKIWGDCIRCHKFPDCDETAVAITI